MEKNRIVSAIGNNAITKMAWTATKKTTTKKTICILVLAFVFVSLLIGAANASPTGKGLPWETTLKTLSDSFKGPVAYAICILMIVAGCFGIMFGGDLAGWIRWACMAAVVIGMIGLSTEVLDMMGMSTITVI